MDQESNKNMMLAALLIAVILVSWSWFYETKLPQESPSHVVSSQEDNIEFVAAQQEGQADQNRNIARVEVGDEVKVASSLKSPAPVIDDKIYPRKDILEKTHDDRVFIKTNTLSGSINLRGAVFDDLILEKYQDSIENNAQNIILLSPKNTRGEYFSTFGFSSNHLEIETPDENSLWQADGDVLTPQTPITLSWRNSQNVLFQIQIDIDENYLFTIKQIVRNNSLQSFNVSVSGQAQRIFDGSDPANFILHEGPIGVFDGILQEKSYKNMQEAEDVEENSYQAQRGWLGVTDKYWLTSLIPDKKAAFSAEFYHHMSRKGNVYGAKFASEEFTLESDGEIHFEQRLFAGAKKVSLLDGYSEKFDIALFDRAVDFGWYYFLTKPFFLILQFFNNIFGNYGLAILAVTVLIKLALFPLANKSYASMAKIKKLQPKIERLRKQYSSNKMRLNQEMMALYKREKANPVSGCLPMLLQIPIFFSLYKVLFVTIDMRHAPFYGWINDLSAPDPTSIFNLFGLLPFEVGGIFLIGVWPILMGLTMILQQKLNPQPMDPAQAKVIKILPYILIFVFAQFPAGLVIYWAWTNILSIAQQWYIMRKLESR